MARAIVRGLDAGQVPASGPAAARYAGGVRAMQQVFAGMDGPPQRGDFATPEAYKAASTRWRSAGRRAQRYAAGQRAPKLTPAEKGQLHRRANVRRVDEALRRGVRIRVRATTYFASGGAAAGADVRTRTMPTGGPALIVPDPGRQISADEAREIVRALARRDQGEAARLALDAFSVVYPLPLSSVQSVEWVKVWPDGEPEPA